MERKQRIYSFGYKMGNGFGEEQFAKTGPSAPVIYDCRYMNNPHNTPHLRRLTGRDGEVQAHVLKNEVAQIMLDNAEQDLKDGLDVAFGCAYGKHRSVAMAELLHLRFPDAIVIHTGAVAMGKNAR